MKCIILSLVVILTMTLSILGVQNIDARECLSPCDSYQPLRVKDISGKSINVANLDQQYTLSWNVSNYLSKFIPCLETITVNASQFDFSNRTWGFGEKEKCISGNEWVTDDRINDYPPSPITVILYVTDDEGKSTYIAWVDASVPPNDFKTFEFSWTPNKTGQHTLTVFTWESIDNPTALSSPSSTTIHVGGTEFTAFLENKPNVIMGCTLAGGTWLDEYDECESKSITEEFENYCNLYGGNHNSCDSGCRNLPDLSDTLCTSQCYAVCGFE